MAQLLDVTRIRRSGRQRLAGTMPAAAGGSACTAGARPIEGRLGRPVSRYKAQVTDNDDGVVWTTP